MQKTNWLALFFMVLTLQSCEFNCSVGKNEDSKETIASQEEDPQILNDIEIKTNEVDVSRAFLSFRDGTLVPANNRIDFTRPVVLQLTIEDGWKEEGGKSFLGVAEKITAEDGSVLLDEKDLFGGVRFEDGISASDAKVVSITANITLPPGTPPTSFTVSFRVWDKKGDGYIEGSYKLYSK